MTKTSLGHGNYQYTLTPEGENLLAGAQELRSALSHHARAERDGVKVITPPKPGVAETVEAMLAAGFAVEEERSFTHRAFPFIHNLLYGLGKPLLESGIFGSSLADVADRGSFDSGGGSSLHPVNLLLKLLNWIDRKNRMNEPPGRSTVNLCLKARKAAP